MLRFILALILLLWLKPSQFTLSCLECFRACVSGCGYKFDIPSEEVDKVRPNRPPKPPPVPKPIRPPVDPNVTAEDVLSTSA